MNFLKLACISALLVSQLFVVGQVAAQSSVKDYERAAIEKLKREKAKAERVEAEQRAAATKAAAEARPTPSNGTIRNSDAKNRADIEAQQAESAKRAEAERLGRLCRAALAQEEPGLLLSNCEKASELGNKEISIAYAMYLYDKSPRSEENVAKLIRHARLGLDWTNFDKSDDKKSCICFGAEHHFIADVLLEFRDQAKVIVQKDLELSKDTDMDKHINNFAYFLYTRSAPRELRSWNAEYRKPFSSANEMLLHGLIPLPAPAIKAAISFTSDRAPFIESTIPISKLKWIERDLAPQLPNASDVASNFSIRALVDYEENMDRPSLLVCEVPNASNLTTKSFAKKVCEDMVQKSRSITSAVDEDGYAIPSIVFFKVVVNCGPAAKGWPDDGCQYTATFQP